MRHHLVIYINGQRHDIRGDDAALTLTDFLRHRLRLTGTKVVCAEGDCGSCTVSVGRVVGDAISYTTVCGCILRLYQLDACHVVTIEGLKYDGQLNPVQEAFVSCHGAQCGFCTPGFVVTLHALLEKRQPVDDATLRRRLTGNLCRCTGYEAILESARTCNVGAMRSLDALYPPGPLIESLARLAAEPVEVISGGMRVYKPTTIAEAVAYRAAHPGCVIVAGGTDLGVVMNKRRFAARVLMTTSAIRQLDAIEVQDDAIVVGANVTHARMQDVLTTRLPEYAQYLEYFGSPQIRNAGTLAGNLATGSPIGDSLPPLSVLDATVELSGPNGVRRVGIGEFYTGYRATVIAPDELMTRVILPLPRPGEILRLFKLSKRKDLDISTFSAAVLMALRDGEIDSIRIAMGGVGPTVVRLRRTEAFLQGRPFDAATLESARPTVLGEIAPISDVRGSADYRNLLAGNILGRLHAELVDANGSTR